LQQVEVDYSEIPAVSRVIIVNIRLRVPQDGNTPLLLAIQIGDTSIKQLLLERGANVDAANKVVFITTPISSAMFKRVLSCLSDNYCVHMLDNAGRQGAQNRPL
jgi:ankyrin repeat protein